MKASPEIRIRRADQHDAPIIALLGRITFSETFGHLFHDLNDLQYYFERTFSVAKIENSLAKENNIFWLATADKLPVGYAKLKLRSACKFLESDHSCQLQKIYVLKDFLSLRIGLGLQEELLLKAKESGASHIWLSVLNENQRAIRFYLKNGFEKIGIHDFSIGKENFKFTAMAKGLS